MNDDRTPNLLPVIQWLEAGCDPKHAAAELRIYAERLAALSAAPAQEPVGEHPAEEALRSLACWLGVGGYNAPTVDAKLYEQKIREGVTVYSQLHGFAARDLAETVLHMDLITPKGIRARELARQVLGIVPPFASPLPKEPQDGKALTDERVYELAKEHFGGCGHDLIWQDDPRYATACDMPKDARWSTSTVRAEQTLAFARAIERELRGAQEGKAGEWSTVERDGMPPCDGETVFVGINSAGFACCFNQARPDGLCLMGSPECSTAQMSELRWWRVLDRPSPTLASREGEQR